MKFIKLNGRHDNESSVYGSLFINPDLIKAVGPSYNKVFNSEILVDDHFYLANETPEEIMEKINEIKEENT